MFSTTNGCTCHMIQSPGQPFLQCISCRGRDQKAKEGKTCTRCGVGVHTHQGDSDYMNGLCSECYYGE